MEHAMQQIASQGMGPVQKEDKPAHAHVHAHAILAAFSDQSVEERRMGVVFRMAVGDARLTAGQLEDELRAAVAMAAEADKNAGFKVPEGAKGQAKYGPKRASMNTVSSTVRQVWGALVHCNLASETTSDGQRRDPSTVIKPSTGFAYAVKAARKALKDHGIDWRGSPLPSEGQKQASAEAKAQQQEMDKYASEHPMRAGETIAEFQERQRQAVEIRLLNSAKERDEKTVLEAAESIWKDLGPELASMVADALYDKWNAYAAAEAEKAKPVPDGEAV